MWVNVRGIIERTANGTTEIIIQKRNKPDEEISFELPGGRLEEFESMVDGLKREIYEETGLKVTFIQNLDQQIITSHNNVTVECMTPYIVYQTTKGKVDSMGIIFLCSADGTLLTEGDNTEDIQWISLENLHHLMNKSDVTFTPVAKASINRYLTDKGFSHSIPN
ncbi:NUDIX domain-containing protein [Paenibacillus woosongensis]|uniref:NUDIX domain-containing protein n=1 Tax=Paenibacillus woosongensis TaxID=307580 RepID=A0AA95KXC1_9BACL|nr:NUDIX domain-containing protein [Paenibacillus woosongensis]WHX50770.1 NUDIX domain-containing protein [Paenibacillus woosongensis]